MALLIQNSHDSTLQGKQGRFRRGASAERASERSLVSPLMLKRPAGRAIYWTVFALLLLLTLVTLVEVVSQLNSPP